MDTPTGNGEGVAPKVWVADDDDDFRALVVETLAADGYAVAEARDGGELLSLIDQSMDSPATRPDVIITDVRMPRLSGLGVLAYLRRVQVRLPVVLMTGFFPESVGVLARRFGAFGVLAKPFAAEELRAAVNLARRSGAMPSTT